MSTIFQSLLSNFMNFSMSNLLIILDKINGWRCKENFYSTLYFFENDNFGVFLLMNDQEIVEVKTKFKSASRF